MDSLPNDLLFCLFVEKLEHEHDRRVSLTTAQCMQLVEAIHERGTATFSFPYRPQQANGGNVYGEDEDGGDEEGGGGSGGGVVDAGVSASASTGTAATGSQVKRSESSNSLATNVSTVTSHSVNSHNTTETAASKFGGVGSSGGHSMPFKTHLADDTSECGGIEATDEVVPQWLCFVKSINSTHIMLCFLPATYADLQILMKTQQQQHRPQQQPQQQETPADIDLEGENQDSEQFEASAGAADVGSHTDDHQDRESSVNSSPRRRSSNAPPTSSSPIRDGGDNMVEEEALVLPIYIYNCPLQMLTDQLVNKWTYHRPDDISEDLTFK